MTAMAEGARGRPVKAALAVACLAAVLNWWASSMVWVSVSGDANGLTASVALTAHQAAPLQPGTALLGAAAVIALLTLGERLLRIAMLACAVMAASCAGQVAALLNPDRRQAVVSAAAASGDVTLNAVAVVVALLGSLALLAVAVIGFTAQGSRPMWSSRYERGARPAKTDADPAADAQAPDARSLWRALDRGEDPT